MSPPLCRHRCRNEENFGEQRYSLDTARDGFVGDRQGSIRKKEPLVFEHDHGITNSRKLPRWEQERGGLDPNLEHQRNPRVMGLHTSQEVVRTSDHRSNVQEDTRRFQDQNNLKNSNYLKTRRSPVQQDRQNPVRPGNRDGPTNHKRKTGPQPARETLDYGEEGRAGQARNQPRFQQRHQDPPREEQRTGYRSLREGPVEQGHHWAEEQRHWEHVKSESVDQQPARVGSDPKMPHKMQREWNDEKMNTMTVVAEETLTVKVDMSQPVNRNR